MEGPVCSCPARHPALLPGCEVPVFRGSPLHVHGQASGSRMGAGVRWWLLLHTAQQGQQSEDTAQELHC
eukprot:1664682-Lingulodinium_polyedra.AAC.2